MVATITFVLCTLIVLPGQITDNYIPPNPHFSHGWPATFLERDVDDTQWTQVDGMSLTPSINWAILDPPSSPPWLSWDSWRFWHAKEIVWKPLNLLLDLAVVMANLAIVTAAWEFRRRRRGNVLQLRLTDFFLAIAVVAVTLTWVRHHWEGFDEWDAFASIESASDNDILLDDFVDVCPKWLVRLVGLGNVPDCFVRLESVIIFANASNVEQIEDLIPRLGEFQYLRSAWISWDSEPLALRVRDAVRKAVPDCEIEISRMPTPETRNLQEKEELENPFG